MSDPTKDADDIIARLRERRKTPIKRRFVFVTRAVEFEDTDLGNAALQIETTIEKVSSSLETVNAPLRVLDVIITPLVTSTQRAGRDADGDLDFFETHNGAVITFKLG